MKITRKLKVLIWQGLLIIALFVVLDGFLGPFLVSYESDFLSMLGLFLTAVGNIYLILLVIHYRNKVKMYLTENQNKQDEKN